MERLDSFSTKGGVGGPIFWRIHQSPFFGILEVCMSGPEEDLAQGGRFPCWFERFIKLFVKKLLLNNFLKRSNHYGK